MAEGGSLRYPTLLPSESRRCTAAATHTAAEGSAVTVAVVVVVAGGAPPSPEVPAVVFPQCCLNYLRYNALEANIGRRH